MDGYILEHEVLFDFYKVSPDNKVLREGQYELYSIDGTPTGIKSQVNEGGRHKIVQNYVDDPDYKPDFVEKVLPNVVKNELKTVNSLNDLEKFRDFGTYFKLTSTSYSGPNNIATRGIRFNIPVVLKQIKSDPGYTKKDMITSMNVYVDYYYNDSNVITKKTARINYSNNWQYLENSNIGTIDDITDLNSLVYNQIEDLSCLNTNDGMIISDLNLCTEREYYGTASYSIIPFFTDEEGEVNLTITNTVNGVQKYDASVTKNLKYKIIVKNTGNTSSSNNIIVTHVPKEVKVIENSIINGIYNSNNHTITWNIDYIAEDETINLQYEAIAPKEMKTDSLIGKSSIESDQVSIVQSSETVVVMNKSIALVTNPKTGNFGLYIRAIDIFIPMYVFALLSIIIISIIIFTKKRKKDIVKYLK